MLLPGTCALGMDEVLTPLPFQLYFLFCLMTGCPAPLYAEQESSLFT